MHKLKEAIDATKYDIRGLWTGLKEEHTSADAGVVEGYPFDPPDDGTGWCLVAFDVHEGKKDSEPDRYWTLWVREKPKTRKRRRARAPKVAPDIQAIKDETAAAVVSQPVPKSPRERQPKKKKLKMRPRAAALPPEGPEPPPVQTEEAQPAN